MTDRQAGEFVWRCVVGFWLMWWSAAFVSQCIEGNALMAIVSLALFTAAAIPTARWGLRRLRNRG